MFLFLSECTTLNDNLSGCLDGTLMVIQFSSFQEEES